MRDAMIKEAVNERQDREPSNAKPEKARKRMTGEKRTKWPRMRGRGVQAGGDDAGDVKNGTR